MKPAVFIECSISMHNLIKFIFGDIWYRNETVQMYKPGELFILRFNNPAPEEKKRKASHCLRNIRQIIGISVHEGI